MATFSIVTDFNSTTGEAVEFKTNAAGVKAFLLQATPQFGDIDIRDAKGDLVALFFVDGDGLPHVTMSISDTPVEIKWIFTGWPGIYTTKWI